MQSEYGNERVGEIDAADRPHRQFVASASAEDVDDGHDDLIKSIQRRDVDGQTGMLERIDAAHRLRDDDGQTEGQEDESRAANPERAEIRPLFPVRVRRVFFSAEKVEGQHAAPHRRQQDIIHGERAVPRRKPHDAQNAVEDGIGEAHGKRSDGEYGSAETVLFQHPAEKRIFRQPLPNLLPDAGRDADDGVHGKPERNRRDRIHDRRQRRSGRSENDETNGPRHRARRDDI